MQLWAMCSFSTRKVRKIRFCGWNCEISITLEIFCLKLDFFLKQAKD